ncbi:hypothetical protein OC842_002473 [Tilletia horrida]|uniref:DUF6604 domain-containing protein n=1 Tax=Tilletia horrida TaxID=155126 RepID=A0AAN6GDM4_9BASI|nr:hypothetical protein OC842_002473 [Tilletia horrida]
MSGNEGALLKLLASKDGHTRKRNGPAERDALKAASVGSQCTLYERCAQDTLRVVTWIGRAALQHGFPVSRMDVAEDPFPFRRGLFSDDDVSGDEQRAGRPEGERTAQQKKNAKKNAKKKAKKKERKQEQQQQDTADKGVDADDLGDDAEEEDGAEAGAAAAADAAPPVNTEDGAAPSAPSDAQARPPVPLPAHDYAVHEDLLIELARFLARKEVAIPKELLQLLCRCTSTRTSIVRRFFDPIKSNKCKREFKINALRDVGKILLEASAAAESKEKDGAAEAKDARCDSFGAMEQAFLAESKKFDPVIRLDSPKCPLGGTIDARLVHFNFNPTFQECVLFALTFFADLHDVRQRVVDLWVDWSNGKVDLTAAAITSTSALEFLRRPHDILMHHTYPHLHGAAVSIFTSLAVYVRVQPKDELFPETHPLMYSEVPDEKPELQKVYDQLFLPTFCTLQRMADKQKGAIILYDPEQGVFDDTLDFDSLPYSKKWQQVRHLLQDSYAAYSIFLASFEPGSRDEKDFFRTDEMARAMRETMSSPECTLHAVFAAQLFVDINLKLRAKTHRGVEELREGARQMTASLPERAKVEPKQPLQIWSSAKESVVRFLLADLANHTKADDDPVAAILEGLNIKGGARKKPMHNRMLVQRNPIMCGMSLYRLRTLYQNQGLKIVNSFRTVMVTAHLFHACQGASPKFPVWQDLELLLRQHGIAEFFGGERPKTADEAFTRLMKMLSSPDELLHTLRQEDTGAPLSKIEEVPMPELAAEDTLLNDSAKIRMLFQEKFFEAKASVDYAAALQDLLVKRKMTSGKGAKGRQGITPLSPLALLSELQVGLSQERLSTNFDYVSMHTRCLRALKIIHTAVDKDIWARHRWRSVVDHELPEITSATMILRDAARTEYAELAERRKEEALRGGGGEGSQPHQQKKGSSVVEHEDDDGSAKPPIAQSPILLKAAETLARLLRDPNFGADTEARKLGLSSEKGKKAATAATGNGNGHSGSEAGTGAKTASRAYRSRKPRAKAPAASSS